MIEWLKKNNIGIQVSLDDLTNSKPLNNGESSSKIVIQNITKLEEVKIDFSINTVLDYNNTKNMNDLIDYVCSLKSVQWGLSAFFTIDDDAHIRKIIEIIKLDILRLITNKFDINNNLRFYNEVLSQPGRTCTAGVGTFALGTNLEVWSCQSLIDQKPLGYFDENIQELLETNGENKYFRDRTLLPQCTDCGVLNWCRGGCRVVHKDKKLWILLVE